MLLLAAMVALAALLSSDAVRKAVPLESPVAFLLALVTVSALFAGGLIG